MTRDIFNALLTAPYENNVHARGKLTDRESGCVINGGTSRL